VGAILPCVIHGHPPNGLLLRAGDRYLRSGACGCVAPVTQKVLARLSIRKTQRAIHRCLATGPPATIFQELQILRICHRVAVNGEAFVFSNGVRQFVRGMDSVWLALPFVLDVGLHAVTDTRKTVPTFNLHTDGSELIISKRRNGHSVIRVCTDNRCNEFVNMRVVAREQV